MQAVLQTRYGSPSVLQRREVPIPTPQPHEILIKVHATTATAADAMMRKGQPWIGRLYTGLTKPKRPISGVEFAGQVQAIGHEVQHFQPGDQVFGETTALGAYAEYLCIPQDSVLTTMPPNMSYEQAAPISAGAITALNFLRMADIQPGQRVLIYGASGSVGTYALQLAKHFKTEVTAIASTQNLPLLKSLGADHVIDYTRQDFCQTDQTYHIIFDTVGKTTFSQCKPLLSLDGTYLSTVLSFPLLLQMIATSLHKGKKAKFSATGMRPIAYRRALLLELKTIYALDGFHSVIDRQYPLHQIVEAHTYVDQGHKVGNVIIKL